MLALAAIVIGLFLASALPLVIWANRRIGAHYAAQAAALEPLWAAEGVRFAEANVRTRARWTAPLAIAVRWPMVDLRVTSRAIYLVQWQRMFGKRMAQPVVAIPLAAAAIDLPGVLVARLAGPPHLDGGALVLEGGLGRQRFVWRLFVRDPPALLAAIARPVEALTAAALKTPP